MTDKEPLRYIDIEREGELKTRHWFPVGNSYNEGCEVAWEGWTIDANPYIDGSVKWFEWRKGWRAGQ